MELLSPPSIPCPAVDRAPCRATLRRVVGCESPTQLGASHDGMMDGIVHVAVGRSAEKTLGLLHWTFNRFGCREVVLVHVHQPSPTIPTLLGKLPASQASEELVSAYRREERECTKKILLSYMSICYRVQVGVNIITIETEQFQKGIVDLVAKHGIRKLVVGGAPDSCFKVKGRSSTAAFIAKNAPPFCEISFVSKGRHIWTREASEDTGSLPPVSGPDEDIFRQRLGSRSLHNHNSEPMCNPEHLGPSEFTSPDLRCAQKMVETESNNDKVISSLSDSTMLESAVEINSTSTSSTGKPCPITLPLERRFSPVFSSKDVPKLKPLHNQIREVTKEAEKSNKKVFVESVKRKKLELETAETNNRLKASQAVYAQEIKLRQELDNQLKTAKLKIEELVDQRNEVVRQLRDAMGTIATLDGYAQEVARQRDEAARQLDFIQASIETLRLERQKIHSQREEAGPHLESWRNCGCAWSLCCNRVVAFGNDTRNFTEFSLSDLQTATCDFSESFKLGQGGYGCVYKGEMLNKTVAIKKLHLQNVQCQSEFQQEVYVLSKLRHPHLVTLIGVCPEGLFLVYEYLSNGSLHDRLFCKTSIPPLTWEMRIRIATEISSALLFLHSSKPEKIIHGNLKPENIFLDSDFNCKIGDFGLCRLVPEDTADYPLVCWNTEPKRAVSHADPEYQRTGVLTSKSDVYTFGIIVLQLLTGKHPVGLAMEVRRAFAAGRLSSILDPSAGEWPLSIARKLADFALQCTEMNSRDRPEFTPLVVRELKELHVPEQRPVPSYFLCPILQEIMHDPQVAADGFTYEGSALRGWLQNGRETSPMTNLKLEHLNLTPNHALRFAIQDWLCCS